MNRVRIEITIGIFMIIGIICLTYLSVKLGKMELFGSDSYRLTARFDSVSGLKQGARVELAGVEVGTVERIGLAPAGTDQAEITLKIHSDVSIADDVIATVRTSGIIGDKYIKLKPGGAGIPLKNGNRIRETESALDIEELVSKFIHGKVD
jgi:phospholipid/cholesterol/gamma-HCH transport system substrate-binding protein